MPLVANPRRKNGSARTKLRRRVAAAGGRCWICRKPIDYLLKDWLDPGYFVLDELRPVKDGGDPLDPSNVAPAHRACNAWRGTKSVETVRLCQRLGLVLKPQDEVRRALAAHRRAQAREEASGLKNTREW